MMRAGDLSKGMYIQMKDEPFAVADREFVNPGKGSSFVRLKLKNLRTGAVLKDFTRKTQDPMDEIIVEDVDGQFLYSDGESFHFMNTETFDQFEVPCSGMDDYKYFLKEGDTYQLVRWEEEVLDIKLPPKMVFEVTEAEDSVKGDTVNGASKYVKIETGLTVKVPIFIKQNERIRISTDTKEYLERVNK